VDTSSNYYYSSLIEQKRQRQWTVDDLLALLDFFVGVMDCLLTMIDSFVGVVEADQPSFPAAVEGS